MESILTSVKKLLGITEEYEQFDPDIIMHINTVFTVLRDLGVGPKEGFMIIDKTTTWNEYISDISKANLMSIKSYIYLKVRLLFDPPASSVAVEAMKEQISELEWRINFNAEEVNSNG